MTDTIFALSSGIGKSGVAVIRISGRDLRKFMGGLFQDDREVVSRHAYLLNLMDKEKNLIDQVIAIYFAAPNSFTGEDVIEIHSHGSSAVIDKVFDFLQTHGFRMAMPGEFSRRAFDNGKMDLAEVDGLVALLDARTDRQRANALKTMTGRDSAVYESWRSQMIEISAYAAAILDYASDELPENIGDKLLNQTKKLYDEISTSISDSVSRQIHSGFNVVIAGPTNAGKSSLFNRLIGTSRAIVSDIPGTTRDVVSSELDIDGYLVRIADTAGLRDTVDTVEKIGIEKTNDEIENADLIIRVQSADEEIQNIVPADNEIIVINKSDLLKEFVQEIPASAGMTIAGDAVLCSAAAGYGISELMGLIKQKIHAQLDGAESDITINARTRDMLMDATAELKTAIDNPVNYELFSEHVRRASDSIGRVLGVISAAEVMDATFSQLCLGK